MTNKRQLKKYVRYVCGDLAAELLIARALYTGFDADKVSDIIGKIADLQVKTLANVTFDFDKARKDYDNKNAYNAERKAYTHKAYKKLLAEFDAGVTEIVKEMNAAMPESLRKAAKA